MENVADTLNNAFFSDNDGRGFRTLRACDCDRICQRILLASGGGDEAGPRCQCVFTDIRGHIPEQILKKFEEVQKRYAKKLPGRNPGCSGAKTAKPDAQAMKATTDALMRDLIQVLQSEQFSYERDSKLCWCLKHDRLCPLVIPTKEGCLVIWAGGVSCLDWSTVGLRNGWAGDGCVANMAWFACILACKPHVVIIECTPHYSMTHVRMILEPTYTVMNTKLCPTMFGVPSRRVRSWSVCTLNSAVDVAFPFGGEKFQDLFFRELSVDPACYFTGTQEQREQFKVQLAKRNKTPCSGQHLPLAQILPMGSWLRMHGYRLLAQKLKYANSNSLLFDRNQDPLRVTCLASDVCPTLLRKSNLLALRVAGQDMPDNDPMIILPAEHLTVMGWPPIEGTQVLHAFRHLVPKLSASALRAITGNMMHMKVAGVAMLYIMAACTLK